MMLFLCLSAGMLYWGVLVFKVTTNTVLGQFYWVIAALLGFLATTLGWREVLKTLDRMLLARDTSVETLESAEHRLRAELRLKENESSEKAHQDPPR